MVKDLYCSYYTDSDAILNYMIQKLSVENGDLILEPAAGSGSFIDALLECKKSIRIDALDVNEEAIALLSEKYNNNDIVSVRKTDTLFDHILDTFSSTDVWLKLTDTLLDDQLDMFAHTGGHYDKVIGNPPYGAWQDYEKRAQLKLKYAGHYVKETYSLFLLRCISVLKMGGALCFIVPDTFLFLNMHKRLREVLLTKTAISEIVIFPSKFFPGVCFGYSNLSIITLKRATREEAISNTVSVFKGFKDVAELCNFPNGIDRYNFTQSEILAQKDCKFVLTNGFSSGAMANVHYKLGDIANIVTGFYCGDNSKYLRCRDRSVKGSKNYECVSPADVRECSSEFGIDTLDEVFIPYIKSVSRRRYIGSSDEWYVRWDKAAIEEYHNNRKARFQNSQFYFKEGIAIPMVKSKSIKATLINNRVFDQSVVGIFPKDNKYLYYILAMMNSDVVSSLIHVINPTANNSANYIKDIPFIFPNDSDLATINDYVKSIIERGGLDDDIQNDDTHSKIDSIIDNIYTVLSPGA